MRQLQYQERRQEVTIPTFGIGSFFQSVVETISDAAESISDTVGAITDTVGTIFKSSPRETIAKAVVKNERIQTPQQLTTVQKLAVDNRTEVIRPRLALKCMQEQKLETTQKLETVQKLEPIRKLKSIQLTKTEKVVGKCISITHNSNGDDKGSGSNFSIFSVINPVKAAIACAIYISCVIVVFFPLVIPFVVGISLSLFVIFDSFYKRESWYEKRKPGMENCEWLNKIVKKLWPCANDAVKKLFKDVIEPKIANALADYYSGFHFNHIILGEIPPRILGVKVYDKKYDKIVMDLDLFYAGDCDIKFNLFDLRGWVTQFKIRGIVRVVLKPLLGSTPLVGGLQIFFLKNPNIDYKLDGFISFLNLPGIRQIIESVIIKQIAAFMVYPNKIKLGDKTNRDDSDSDDFYKDSELNNSIFSFATLKKLAILVAICFICFMGPSLSSLIPLIVTISLAWLIISVALDQWRRRYRYLWYENRKTDMESCEWVNKIVQKLWPNVKNIARNIVKDVCEPKIAKAFDYFYLYGFRFHLIMLGKIPPRIVGIKVYDKNDYGTKIIMDLDLFYASDCDISFRVAGMKGGIKELKIRGIVRVVLKPFIKSLPLVGGLQIFFLNDPQIDYNLYGVIEFLNLKYIDNKIRRLIGEQIASVMVFPNKLQITLS